MSRLARTGVVSAAALGLAAMLPVSGPASATPVQTLAQSTAYGGFSTSATATPLRIEVHEPAIPVPADPEVELNFSYTHVEGASGPTARARASAMWPGAAVGEGLKTIIEQVGLPSALGAAGYPVQINVETPGDPSSASQEFLPGMVGRAEATPTHTVAKAGYSTSGDLAGSDGAGADSSGGAGSAPNLLDLLKSGDLGALGNLLTGTKQSSGDDGPPPANPLGALSLLVSVGGMSSTSSTTYVGDSVVSSATSQLGDVKLLAGLVELNGVTVATSVTSSLDSTKTTQKVTYGGMSILGVPFAFTSDGIEAMGKTTAIPGLSDVPTTALKQLGITIDLPKPTHSVDGSHGVASAMGPTITIDTAPLITQLGLNKLPIGDLVNKFPDSAGQLKGLLLAAAEAHPKLVIAAGSVTSEAATIAGVSFGGPSTLPTTGGTTTGGGAALPPIDGGSAGVPSAGAPPTTTAPTTTAPINPVSAIPGLPPLGSVPGLLTLGAIILGLGAGWWFRRAAAVLFGGAGTCPHGLESGLPDLRKV